MTTKLSYGFRRSMSYGLLLMVLFVIVAARQYHMLSYNTALWTFGLWSAVVFVRRKKVVQGWNDMRASKWWQNVHFWMNYPFNRTKLEKLDPSCWCQAAVFGLHICTEPIRQKNSYLLLQRTHTSLSHHTHTHTRDFCRSDSHQYVCVCAEENKVWKRFLL